MALELIGSLFLVLALLVLVGLYIARPFFQRRKAETREMVTAEQRFEHDRSALLAEHDRVLTSLQELDFDNALGKIPAEEYPHLREALLKNGVEVLRRLDAMQPAERAPQSVEDRIEAAVAARRADAARTRQPAQPVAEAAGAAGAQNGNGHARPADAIEDLIATRKRARPESAAGFCPKCGKPVSKSDKFCSRCGAVL